MSSGTNGGSATLYTYPDWLSPSTAGRPEWDPYGPGSYIPPLPSQAPWDPYAPSYGVTAPSLHQADPAAEGLVVQGDIRSPNRLYLQRGGILAPEGSVILGEAFDLWAYVGYYGNLVLYDGSDRVFTGSYVAPGWYRISGLRSEILYPHRYRFVVAGQSSNELSVNVDSGGYPSTFGLTGRVVDDRGVGIPGVDVRISGAEGGRYTTRTNALGYYGLDLPTGIYTVTAELPGYSFTQSAGRVWTGTVSVARIIVGYRGYQEDQGSQRTASVGSVGQTYSGRAPGYVEGMVSEQSGAAIPWASISVDSLPGYGVTDASGRFSLALTPGAHSISASSPGYGIASRSVLVRAGETSRLTLIGKRTLTLGSGR